MADFKKRRNASKDDPINANDLDVSIKGVDPTYGVRIREVKLSKEERELHAEKQ